MPQITESHQILLESFERLKDEKKELEQKLRISARHQDKLNIELKDARKVIKSLKTQMHKARRFLTN